MGVRSANQFDGELAALRHQREMDALGESPVVDQVLDVTVKLAEKAGLPPFMGLFRKALKIGQPSFEKMVDDLESAAFEEIRRIWEHLHGQEERQKEFEGRLNSHEAQVAYLSACFHGLRTSDPQKHSRLARLTINCVFADDLEPASLDGMMQATVELKEEDIVLLGNLYKWQNHILIEKGMNPDKWFGDIQQAHKRFVESAALDQRNHLMFRSSYMRLESLGLVQEIPSITNHYGVGFELYALLLDGRLFYERLQEVS